jgi:DNA-binding transcriptional ArsR family regulator
VLATRMENGRVTDIDSNDLWQDRAQLLRLLAHPVRLTILELLCERPRCVKEINALVPLTQAHLSQHMAALRKANLVASHACGTLRCYYILQPTLVRKLIPLPRQQHPVQERDCQSVMREARRDSSRVATAAV